MGLPRPNRTKYGASFAQISALSGEHVSSLKRQAAKDKRAFSAKVDALLSGTVSDALSEPERADELEDVIWRVHFTLCRIGWGDASLRAKLRPAFDLTRPVVESI